MGKRIRLEAFPVDGEVEGADHDGAFVIMMSWKILTIHENVHPLISIQASYNEFLSCEWLLVHPSCPEQVEHHVLIWACAHEMTISQVCQASASILLSV